METTETFRDSLGALVASSQTTLFIAVGSELKLFDVLGKFTHPTTSQEIADAADCKEEFIRAWLHVMVAGKIVDAVSQEDDVLFFLPKHRLHSLVSTESNLASMAQLLPMYAVLCGDLVKGFKKDSKGGIKQEQMKQFFSHYEEENSKKYSVTFLRNIISQVPGLKEKLEKGIKVCDLGCGSGHYVNMLAKMYPKCTVIGLDLTEEILAPGRKQAETLALKNVSFQVGSAENLPAVWIEYLDYCTVTNAVHHLQDPMKMMTDVYKALKPGGIFSVFDSNIHSKLQDNIGKWTSTPIYSIKLVFTGMDHGHHGHGHGHGHGHTVGHGRAHGHVVHKQGDTAYTKGHGGSHGAVGKDHGEKHDATGKSHAKGRRGSHGAETSGHADQSHHSTAGANHGKARRASHGDKSHDPSKHVDHHPKGHSIKGAHQKADVQKEKTGADHDEAKVGDSSADHTEETQNSTEKDKKPRSFSPHEGQGITMGMEVPTELLKKAGFITYDPVPVAETLNIHIVAIKPKKKKVPTATLR